MPNIIQVSIPGGNIFDYLDYLAPDFEVEIGARVKITLRGKIVIGVAVAKKVIEAVAYKLRPVIACLDSNPILSEKQLALAKWLANYYQSPLGDVLRTMLPKKIRLGEPLKLPQQISYQVAPNYQTLISKQARKQQAIIDFIERHSGDVSLAALMANGFQRPQLSGMVKKALLIEKSQDKTPLINPEPNAPLNLNSEQQQAVELICSALESFKAYLLFGVTGSGKTEVYFQVMQQVLAQGKQVLVLVPEIGLTPQFIKRVENRFSQGIAVIHSNLNDTERLSNWLWCQRQQAKILIGTRSAVFTPLPTLGLIIVDEEHDLSFKQQEGMRFSGRDVALKRGADNQVPVILGSATPALESLANADSEKYHLLTLSQRAVSQQPNYYRIVDLRNQKIIDGLCSATLERIKAHLSDGNQVMVYINRRGYAPILICHQCAWMTDCPYCSAHLIMHGRPQKMQCHHCGYLRPIPFQCEACQSEELIAVGAGTERIANYLTACLPDFNVMRIDRDTTKGKTSLQTALQNVDDGNVDVLVGTQLLAKGHHFKRLTLVVVVDADAGFYSADFRAVERLGQMLMQVAGRAGRESEGEVVIQTHQPGNPHLNTLIKKGYRAFSQQLLQDRKNAMWPPYAYLALCRARGKHAQRVQVFFVMIKKLLSGLNNELILLGPAPAPMEKKAGEFQLQLLIRSSQRLPLLQALQGLRQLLQGKAYQKKIASLKFSIDVDPQDLS